MRSLNAPVLTRSAASCPAPSCPVAAPNEQPVTTQLYQASAFVTLCVPGVAPLLPAHLMAVATSDWQQNTRGVYVSQLQRNVADVLLKMAQAGDTKVCAAAAHAACALRAVQAMRAA